MSHPRTPRRRTPATSNDTNDTPVGARAGRWLAAGVPWFGAFTAIAAAMNVLALAISGPEITDTADRALMTADWSHPVTWAALMLKIGASGLAFLPVLVAGCLAYGMAGPSGLVPGLLSGMAAMGLQGGALTALAAGLIAGAATTALQRIPVPAALSDVTATALVPLLASLISAAVLIALVADGVNAVTAWLQSKLGWLEFHHTVLTGMLLGLMICSDLGGAISKTALAFGTVGVSGPDPSRFSPLNMTMMAAIVAAGMVPPLGMTLATLVRSRLFTPTERSYGKVSWLFGAAFVPEGAIPFALTDPLRVIPAGMAGGAVTGALIMSVDATITVPYGGVFAVGRIGHPLFFALALAAGVLVTAAAAVALKSLRRKEASSPVTAVLPRNVATLSG